MKEDFEEDLGDWRISAVGRLASDLPAAFPGGPSHKAGTPLYLKPTLVRHPKHNFLGFVTPSPTAMAFNIAIRSAKDAQRLRKTLVFSATLTPFGAGKLVANENLLHLYDYFELCMIAVTFSYQSLETFANSIIVDNLKGTYQLQRRSGPVDLTATELEREASTEEKIATILPTVLKIKSPKGGRHWDKLVKLKRARDSTIHLKSHNEHNSGDLDKESLFYQFLNDNIAEYPKYAFDIIEYFIAKDRLPRWAKYIKNELAK